MQHWQALGYVHPDEMFEIAAVAEEAGFEGLLLSDHVFVPEERHSDYPYSETGDPDFPEAPSFPDAFMVMAVLYVLVSTFLIGLLLIMAHLRLQRMVIDIRYTLI